MARKMGSIGFYRMSLVVGLICMAFSGTAWSQDAAQTTTTRDDRGVWFIQGGEDATLYDMFAAMGYAVATDRLWQAELYRRQARGRLAEIFGAGAEMAHLKTDIFMRTIGYTEAQLEAGFAALNQDTQQMVLGYVAGFNRRIGEILADPSLSLLPFEFAALTRQLGTPVLPEPWTPTDILAWYAILQRNFDPEALDTGQLDNLGLIQYLQQIAADENQAWGMFEDLRWTNDADAATYFDPGRRPCRRCPAFAGADLAPEVLAHTAASISAERKEIFAALERLNARVRMGSYAWVVSGEHTQSGNPILYSGPQMGFSVPAIVTEGSLRGAGIEISGMTIAGIPSIIIGRTPHHTWSMQVGHAHTTDYYLDTTLDGITLDRTETIGVAGGEAVTIPVFHSAYGPVISPLPLNPATYAFSGANPIVSWRYAHQGHEFMAMEGFLDLARAGSMDEFGDGIEKLAVSQHFCYADQEGNIAYWMSGRNPQRFAGEWRLPQGSPGIGPSDWVAGELVPRSTDRNTPEGYYGGWNNKSQPDYDNAYNSINDIYGPFQRAHVIYEYLDRRVKKGHGRKLSFEEIRDLALNIATTDSLGLGGNPWSFVAPYFKRAVWQMNWQRGDWRRKIDRWRALWLLRHWDGHFVAGGESQWAFGSDRADAWMLMDAWVHEVLRLTFGDELGPYLSDTGEDDTAGDHTAVMAAKEWPNGELRVLINVLLHALDRHSDIVNTYDWFRNMGAGPAGRDNIIVAALDNALDYLGERPWGTDKRGWIEYRHPILSEVLPDPVIWQTPFSSRSTYAHVVEMGPDGPVRIESMFPLGESGHISVSPEGMPVLSEHFFTMTDLYDAFAPREFPLFD
jgi:penicillin amidase